MNINAIGRVSRSITKQGQKWRKVYLAITQLKPGCTRKKITYGLLILVPATCSTEFPRGTSMMVEGYPVKRRTTKLLSVIAHRIHMKIGEEETTIRMNYRPAA